MLKVVALLSLTLALAMSQPARAAACDSPAAWDRWQAFRTDIISREGRVIDYSDERRITTSEGQSYALFFALVNNDRQLFHRILRWTEKNLARGDLTANLPAWLWGRQASGKWGVLDTNSASDSDLWIAYTLIEAGRLWRQHSYSVLGNLLLRRIAREEVVKLPLLGPMLLPGKHGFAHDGYWKLNPSYLPPQLVARAAKALPAGPWRAMVRGTEQLLVDSAPQGLAPDWISWTGKQFEARGDEERIGSYDAIRVYLWVGMLHDDAPGARRLKQHFRAIERHVSPEGRVDEEVDIYRAVAHGGGPGGFSAALLPLLAGSRHEAGLRAALERSGKLGYYSQVLALFGSGWDEGRYRFGADGTLMPRWEKCQ